MSGKSLVIMLNNPGDVVMAQLAMKGTSSYLLTSSENRDLFEEGSNVLYFPRVEIQNIANSSSVDELFATINSFVSYIRTYKFTKIYNLFQGDDSAVLCGILRSENVEIYGRYFKPDSLYEIKDIFSKYLYTIPFNRDLNSKHVVDIYKMILGNSISPESYDVRKSGYIVIHVSAAWETKRYSKENWVQVINLIHDKKIYLTGTKAEISIADYILENSSNNVVSKVGKTSKKEFGEIIKNAELVISADTFAIHLAAYFRTKSITLFGPTSLFETNSYLVGSISIVSKLNTNIYGDFEKDGESTINFIEPELIFDIYQNNFEDISKYNSFVFLNVEEKKYLKTKCLNGKKMVIDSELNDKILDVLVNAHNKNNSNEYTAHISKLISLNQMITLKLQRGADCSREVAQLSKLEEQLEIFPLEYQVFVRVYRIEINGLSNEHFLHDQLTSLKNLFIRVSSI